MSYDVYTYIDPAGIKAQIIPADAKHITFNANTNSGMGKQYPTAHYFDIRGVTYGITVNLNLQSDGTWKPTGEIYISRAESSKPITPAVKRTAVEAITKIVNEWTAKNPQALAYAQTRAHRQAIEAKQQEQAKHRADADKLEREIQAIREELGAQVPTAAADPGEALTKEVCPCCEDHHPAHEGITLYTRSFACPNCGEEWSDKWCSDCNDKCPKCNREIEPSETTEEEVIAEPTE